MAPSRVQELFRKSTKHRPHLAAMQAARRQSSSGSGGAPARRYAGARCPNVLCAEQPFSVIPVQI